MLDELDLKSSSPGLSVLFLLPVDFQRRHFKGPSRIQHFKATYAIMETTMHGGDEKFQDQHLSGRPLFCASLGPCTLYITLSQILLLHVRITVTIQR